MDLLHALKLSEWSSSDEEASIKAVDVLQQFGDGDYYRGDWHAKGITLYALANYVIADAIGTYSIPQDKFFIDKYLKSVEVRNPIPLVSHKEALQIIANAGRCILTVDRYGKSVSSQHSTRMQRQLLLRLHISLMFPM